MGYNIYYRGEIQVSPPLTKEHADLVLAFSKGERTQLTEAIHEFITASAEPDLPGYAGLFQLSEGRALRCSLHASRERAKPFMLHRVDHAGLALWVEYVFLHLRHTIICTQNSVSASW